MASANEFVDHTDHSNEEGFDFLELDGSQFITESDIEEISAFTGSVSLTNTSDLFSGWDYPSCDNNMYYGGNTMNSLNYTPYMPQTQAIPASATHSAALPSTVSATQQVQEPLVSTPTINANPTSLPVVQTTQDMNVPSATYDTVPATVSPAVNNYPNTNVVTSAIFRIKGNPDSNLAGLNELFEYTMADAQKRQRDVANLALAMQKYGQQTGFPTNVSVYSGPIFDIDLTGGMYPQFSGEGNNGNY